MRRVDAFLVFLAICAAATPSESAPAEDFEIFECRDAEGNLSFQNDPCPEIDPSPPPSEPAKPPAVASAPPRPSPRPKPAKRAVASPPPAAKRVTTPSRRPALRVMPPLPPRPRRVAAVPSRAADARYASPRRTWETFAAAMRAGDRAAVRSCFTPEALAEHGPRVDSLTDDELRALVERLGEPRLEPSDELEPFRLLRTSLGAARPKWILLERVAGGEWKIAGL